VAQAFATLGCLYPGRVVLGMGTGESMNEVPLGVDWPEAKERFARFREAVRLIRQLWSEERVTFEGDYYRTDKATIYDRPDQPVPIFLAGSGPAATRFAGREGDGYITTSGKDPALYTDTLIPAVREGAEKAGRQLADIEMMIEVKVSFDHDRDEAMRATHFWGALGLTAEQKSGVEDPVEMQRLADELSVEQTAKRFIVSTDPDEHVEKIKTYIDLGFNHLVFHAPGPDQAKFLKLYGAEILPRLRAL
jgi:coenzyme F420-dependent glucose-6-phosphate dehydrogenase